MKKSLSMVSAAVLASSCLSSTVAFAEGSADISASAVRFYMEAANSSKYELINNNTIIIDSLDEDLTINGKIYFSDPQKGAWSVSPKWNTSNENIKITKVYDPLEEGNLSYYAYAETDADGNLTVSRNESYYSVNKTYGSHNFTIKTNDGKALVPFRETAENYPLVTFDFTIDADTPEGTYEIFFTTEEDNCTRCAMDAAHNNTIYKFPDLPLDVSGITIKIGKDNSSIGKPTDYNFGDINLDGVVDASDASLALVEYAAVATGKETTLDEVQTINGDVNFDNVIDASDASDILRYYAYVSTTSGDIKSLVDFFGREIPENLK